MIYIFQLVKMYKCLIYNAISKSGFNLLQVSNFLILCLFDGYSENNISTKKIVYFIHIIRSEHARKKNKGVIFRTPEIIITAG